MHVLVSACIYMRHRQDASSSTTTPIYKPELAGGCTHTLSSADMHHLSCGESYSQTDRDVRQQVREPGAAYAAGEERRVTDAKCLIPKIFVDRKKNKKQDREQVRIHVDFLPESLFEGQLHADMKYSDPIPRHYMFV
jgi:hypothetical protein